MKTNTMIELGINDVHNCEFLDEAQGKYKCCNSLIKSNRCAGVCKRIKSKENVE